MKTIKKEELIKRLKRKVFDYCMLLPIIENGEGIERIECYASESSNDDFLCYIRYYDGVETMDIHCNRDGLREMLVQIENMKNKGYFSKGCFVALYEYDGLLNDLLKLYKIDTFEYTESFHSTKKARKALVYGKAKFTENREYIQDEEFVNQNGNHIKILEREQNIDYENNRIIYLILEEKIIGYIALKRQYEKIWDVAYIFIDEKYRNHGYATLLCYEAIQSLSSNESTLFYSYCENEASRAVAKKSGLISCAKRYVFKFV